MFNVNDMVQIIGTNIKGKIIKICNDTKALYFIEYNNKLIKVNQNRITAIEGCNSKYISNKNNTFKKNTINLVLNQNDNFIPEIMLRHQTVEIAIFNLDKFIDEAICRNVKIVKIIHGKHGGILRNAVNDYLKSNKNVAEFHLGNYYEGQYGVTIATLK